jgi:aminoglycoside phosphotransferase family enzyme/predicted kinase
MAALDAVSAQEILVRNLRDRALYGGREEVEVMETHISWVLLAGPFAYKIKKAVNLGFLDFGTLEKRRFFCHEELRLNRRFAPELYLEVVPITGTPWAPVLNGSGPALEYAVKMRRFPQSALLNGMLARGELLPEHIDEAARRIAEFHAAAAVAPPGSRFGTPQQVRQPVAENFAQIRPRLGVPAEHPRLDALEKWSEKEFAARLPALTGRKTGGFIRECHGDLHLGNMALLEGGVTFFDCIEFNEDLRWIDVMSETAFAVMDLHDRGRPDLAWRLLNAYLERTGDYPGLAVLRYYLAYRALVRAKVAAIRAGQDTAAKDDPWGQYRSYVALAEKFTAPPRPALIITCGLSGSGKTWGSQGLIESLGAVRVRSDVERKRLSGLAPEARTRSGIGTGLYAPEISRLTYQRLAELGRAIIGAGYPVFVDATFLKKSQRTAFLELAQELGVPFVILEFEAPVSVLRDRVISREKEARDASEAGLAVLEHQLAEREPLSAEERLRAVTLDTRHPVDTDRIRELLESA